MRTGPLYPTLKMLLANIEALESIDPIALYEWALPRVETLRVEFYHANGPTTDFSIWMREQYLKHDQVSA